MKHPVRHLHGRADASVPLRARAHPRLAPEGGVVVSKELRPPGGPPATLPGRLDLAPPDSLVAPMEPRDDDRTGRKKKKNKKKKETGDFGAGRGVETMFRSSYRTHLDLSALADSKANIMISINGIMISILLATIYPSIAANLLLLLPAAVLVLGCLASVVCAVMAARPRVTGRHVTPEEED
jgi:hypothetical protein